MVLEVDVGIYQIESILFEKVALSPQWPHPSKAILSPTELSGIEGAKWQLDRRTGTLLGRWIIFLFLSLQGCLPGDSGHRSLHWRGHTGTTLARE